MAEAVTSAGGEACAGPSSAALEMEADERRQEEALKRSRDPPIVYKDIDAAEEMQQLEAALADAELSAVERGSLDELRQFLVGGEGSWVLGDEFLTLVARVLAGPAEEARVALVRCLAAAALREDVALLLHQDRRQHALLNYAHGLDRATLPEQRAIALFICNLFENVSASEWLLYISEWEHQGHRLSNICTTTKVCVHAALSEDEALRELGTALLHNIAAKEVKTVVFDEVCVELAIAVLQLLSSAPAEEHMYRAARALARLCAHSPSVPPVLAALGPPPHCCRGKSPRVDEQIDLIMAKVK